MSPTAVDILQNGTVKHLEAGGSFSEIEDSDLSRLLDRPRPINIERNRSFDERSFSELSMTLSPPRNFYRSSDNSSRIFEHLESIYSLGIRSGLNTPRSMNCFETHPIVTEAWNALRRSLVHFRGQPVGTIAALDHSSEELNYDQVSLTSYSNYFSGVLIQLSLYIIHN